MTDKVTLYGAPHSLYTGRVRSYLVKALIPYREVASSSDYFRSVVLPKAGNRLSIPAVELPDGTVIRDGVAIMDHFEAQSGKGFSPAGPKQHIMSLLFDVIGAEGLLRPAMHYRWNFPEENKDFINFHFEIVVPAGDNRPAMAEKVANRMREACKAFGANPDTFRLVESLYEELLAKLSAHYKHSPYLLGNKPCVGDFGLMAPMFAHLGRDPKPLSLMQRTAVNVFRWVERMNRADADVIEYEFADDVALDYAANDSIADTLLAVVQHLALDFVPETRAAAECINNWLADQTDLQPGTEVVRGVGMGHFEIQGVAVSALAQPFRFYLLKRVQDYFASLPHPQQEEVKSMLESCGMAEVLTLTINRDIGRKDNLEVWL